MHARLLAIGFLLLLIFGFGLTGFISFFTLAGVPSWAIVVTLAMVFIAAIVVIGYGLTRNQNG